MTQPQIDALLQSLGAIDTWFEGVSSGDVVPCGTVTWRRKESDEGGDDESPSLEADFEDFSPFPFDDLPEGGSTQFDQKVYATASVDGGFDGALDLFFASFEARRDRSQREKSANAAAKKLEKVKTGPRSQGPGAGEGTTNPGTRGDADRVQPDAGGRRAGGGERRVGRWDGVGGPDADDQRGGARGEPGGGAG